MNIKPVASPHAIQPNQVNPTAQADARAKAIAKLVPPIVTQNSGDLPVSNANQVSPEELSAIRGQNRTNEEETTQVAEDTAKIEAPKPIDPVDARLAQLAKKEKSLRFQAQKREQEFKAREDALKAKEDAIAAKDQTYASDYVQKSRLKQLPLETLNDLGLTYDELTQRLLNPQTIDPRMEATINDLKAEIKALKDDQASGKQAAVDAQQQAYNAAVKQIRSDVKQLIANDPNYETVKATNSVNDVVELIQKRYDHDGVLLSVEEASTMVEDYLLEEAIKLTKIGKIKQRLAAQPVQGQAAKQQPQAQSKQPQPMKTLTNATSSSRTLSAKERAILAFRGELKS